LEPVPVIMGDADRIVASAAQHGLVDRLPHAELRIIADAGHAPLAEQPGAVLAAVRAWLTRNRITRC